jgi:uncharacterized protein (TIGR03437 family)
VAINDLALVSSRVETQTLPAGTVLTYGFSAPLVGTPTTPSLSDAVLRVVNGPGVGSVVVYLSSSLNIPAGASLPLSGVSLNLSGLADGTVVTMLAGVNDSNTVNLNTKLTVAQVDYTKCPNPIPAITGLAPASATVFSDPFLLTVSGTNFTAGSQIRWNGTALATTFVSSTQLTANIDASLLTSPILVNVTVFNPLTKPGPGGGSSTPAVFGVQFQGGNPLPVITSVFPASLVSQSVTTDLGLVVSGTGFMKEATVKFNGAPLATDQVFPPTNHVSATVPAGYLASPQLVSIWVENPLPNGGPSNVLTLKIDELPQTLTSIFPTSVPASSALFSMQIKGTNFTSASVVVVDGTPVATTMQSSTALIAAVPTSRVASGGLTTIMVQGTFSLSNAQILTVRNPAPSLESVSPTSVAAGTPPFQLTVRGDNFVPGSVVRWNGQDRTTTYQAGNVLTATIPASDVKAAGTAQITVNNPAPGGGATTALSLTITAPGPNPVPVASSLTPSSVAAGKGSLTLLVNGSSFSGTSVVRWNGQDRPTTVLSASQLQATLTALDVATTGSAQVTVFSPAPAGGLSAALTFTIVLPQTADDLVSSCPSAQEVAAINSKLTLTFDADPTLGALVCKAADGSADLTRLKERAYQALRAMQDIPFDFALPWTSKSLFDWLTGAIKGVRFRADISEATCCDPAGVVNIPTTNQPALQTTRWLDPQLGGAGLANLVVQITGQARKNEGYPLSCGSKDNSLGDQGSWAVQYYLWEWLAFRSGSFLTSSLKDISSGYYSQTAWSNAQNVRDTRFCGTGNGVVVNAASRSFGNQVVSTTSPGQSIVVSATTPSAVTVSGVSFGGANASDFTITNNSCQGVNVPPSCFITALFQPQTLGLRNATLNINTSASGGPLSVALSGTGLPQAPGVNAGGILNGAGFTAALSGGVISSLFGFNLGAGNASASGLPLPIVLGQTSVQVNGANVPLIFVSPQQINFQLPWELLTQSSAALTVTVAGAPSSPQQLSLTAFSPAVFTVTQNGSGQGAILIANAGDLLAAPSGSVTGRASRPAQKGEFVTIYCVGLGDVSNRPATGAASPGSPLATAMTNPTVTIGGVPATVSFAGLAPGFVGLYQINVQVPDTAASGDNVPVVVSVGGATSNQVTMAVQ